MKVLFILMGMYLIIGTVFTYLGLRILEDKDHEEMYALGMLAGPFMLLYIIYALVGRYDKYYRSQYRQISYPYSKQGYSKDCTEISRYIDNRRYSFKRNSDNPKVQAKQLKILEKIKYKECIDAVQDRINELNLEIEARNEARRDVAKAGKLGGNV